MKRIVVPSILAAVGLFGLVQCSDDSNKATAVTGGSLGGVCSCDSDCGNYGNWATMCVKGICMVQPTGDCSDAQACPASTTCVALQHDSQTIPVCALPCNDPDLACLGTCDAQGLCMPGDQDSCLMGCCSVADPPGSPAEDPGYPNNQWDPPVCGPDTYPCPPYGVRRGRVMENEVFLPANQEAIGVAGNDGLFTLQDVFARKPKLIMIFAGAGW